MEKISLFLDKNYENTPLCIGASGFTIACTNAWFSSHKTHKAGEETFVVLIRLQQRYPKYLTYFHLIEKDILDWIKSIWDSVLEL